MEMISKLTVNTEYISQNNKNNKAVKTIKKTLNVVSTYTTLRCSPFDVQNFLVCKKLLYYMNYITSIYV